MTISTPQELEKKYAAWKKVRTEIEYLLRMGHEEEIALLVAMDEAQNLEDRQKAHERLLALNAGKALEGDRQAVQFLLHSFVDKSRTGQPVSTPLMWYFGIAIARILNGEKPARALGLAGDRGRPKSNRTQRDMDLFEAVLQKRIQGKDFEVAIEETSVENDTSESTVKRAYQWFNSLIGS